MEQRTFLAIILSFLFLMTYNSFFVANKKERIINDVNNTVVPSADSISPQETDIKPSFSKNYELNSENYKIYQLGNFQFEIGQDSGIIHSIKNIKFNYQPILFNYINPIRNSKLKAIDIEKNQININYESQNGPYKYSIGVIDDYRIKATLNLTNSFNLDNFKNVQFGIFEINATKSLDNKEFMRDSMLLEFSVFKNGKIFRKNNAFKFSEGDNKQFMEIPSWFGWRDRYHFVVVKPNFICASYQTQTLSNNSMHISTTNSTNDNNHLTLDIFMGPQDLTILKGMGQDIHKIMAFSSNPLLDFIEKSIYNALLLINQLFKNWGISIIFISVTLYLATYPLTIKSMLSMKKMQELQPKMMELREKYKNDPQKLNTEVVQLYRIHNTNPFGGCLPMLLQMPIFISLYQVLWRTHNFENAGFLWIKDLSRPDRLIILNNNLPFIGNEINLLPIVMMIIMFFQQRITSRNTIITDPTQQMQQKMMMYIFPIFIGGIFYHFASGLTLYFVVFYLLSTLTQLKMSNKK